MMRVVVWRRSKLKDCLVKLLKLMGLLLVLMVLVLPIRNTILQFVLPGMWLEHSSLFLFKVMLDSQSFPVADIPIGKNPIKLVPNFDDIKVKFTNRGKTYPAYYEQMGLLQRSTPSDLRAHDRLNELLKFKPMMSEYERAVAMFTVDVFIRACETANLTYFLISGSLLGSRRHHGMIPWDDDIDIIVNGSEWRKVRDVLANIQGFELFSPGKVQWKFFMSALPQGNRPFKWPNIDLFFFNEDETHIWALTWGAKSSLCSKKSDVFPLKRRKFELWNMPVPRASRSLVAAEFGDYRSNCVTASYVHKTNVAYSSSSLVEVSCRNLHEVFPFVFQETGDQGIVIEVLRLAGKPLDNISLSEDF
ncbi:unnamed protein product [Lymnaea stagnalis]|uniref:LicD/FKTN/FKRP nucleotidyltransferase domain-containing protein n=1 Tax=Lymnaea stagnalis TaxID=6523 RepID=A0AAV2I4H8_LYMST